MDDTSGETTVVELPEITIRDCGPRISRETKNEKKYLGDLENPEKRSIFVM